MGGWHEALDAAAGADREADAWPAQSMGERGGQVVMASKTAMQRRRKHGGKPKLVDRRPYSRPQRPRFEPRPVIQDAVLIDAYLVMGASE
jgi:hypothetical protein